jgi:hypothetical protein
VRQHFGLLIDVIQLAASAGILPSMVSGDPTRNHSAKMNRNTLRRHRNQLRLYIWIPRGQQKPESRSPTVHGHSPREIYLRVVMAWGRMGLRKHHLRSKGNPSKQRRNAALKNLSHYVSFLFICL